MSELDQRTKEVFEAALKLPPKERAVNLDQACGEDVQLRPRAEALLQAHEQARGPLDESAASLPTATIDLSLSLAEKPGDRIGRYKLLQQIGEGGCGVVYIAGQLEPVKLRVALKVIRPGMDAREVLARPVPIRRPAGDQQPAALLPRPLALVPGNHR
jgi:eukaryotic-like serine/threonine-protein kinase